MDISDTTLDFFSGLVGETFVAELDGGSIGLQLVSADPLQSGPNGLDLDRSFSLEFEGPVEPALAQGTFTLSHDRLAPAAMFLVPVAQTEIAMRYQAVFNRLA